MPGIGYRCAWKGCDKAFHGAMPADWMWILTFNRPRPVGIVDPARQLLKRDGCLCPEHAARLDAQLIEIDAR